MRRSCPLVDDLEPRSHLSAPPLGPEPQLCAVGSALYFTATTKSLGSELWRTTGSSKTTTLVRDLLPGPASSAPKHLTAAGKRLFFQAFDGKRSAIWTTQGPPQTTLKLHAGEIEAGAAVGSTFLFLTPHNLHHELWRTDGTPAGTRRLVDRLSGQAQLVSAGQTPFIVNGAQILSVDTDTGATRTVYSGAGTPLTLYSQLGNSLLFVAPDAGRPRLWAATATASESIGPAPALEDMENMPAIGRYHYYITKPTDTPQLWRTDGTAAGTTQVGSLPTPTRNGIDPDVPASPYPRLVAAHGQLLAFYAYGDPGQNATELWRIDPATASRTLLLTWTPILTPDNDFPSISLSSFAPVKEGIVFNVRQNIDEPAQAWFSDATTANTHPILPSQFQIDHPISTPGKLFFTHDNSLSKPHRLWVWDHAAGKAPAPL